MKIKICGLKEPDNIMEVAGLNPDFMGFILYPGSSRFVGTDNGSSLFIDLPKGISKVGVFVDEKYEKIVDLHKIAALGMVQLHGNESPAFCDRLRLSGIKIIKVFSVSDDFDFKSTKEYIGNCDHFLFDTKTKHYGGSGKKFNWKKLDDYKFDVPFFLSGGISSEDVTTIKNIKHDSLFAVDVNSRFETAPGVKNVKLLQSFIDSLKDS